jgi:hypothetical protein
MDECDSCSRDSSLDKFFERIPFVDKVDFQQTLNQAGKTAKVFKQKEQGRTRRLK